MKTFWTIAIPLFIGITFLVIKFFEGFMKKETTEKTRKNWTSKMYYWHFILMISGALTTLIILLLKWGDVLTF